MYVNSTHALINFLSFIDKFETPGKRGGLLMSNSEMISKISVLLLIIHALLFTGSTSGSELSPDRMRDRVESDPLKIEGDADLEMAVLVHGWSGNGTVENPFRISGL